MATGERSNLALLLRDCLGPQLQAALVDSFKFSFITRQGMTVPIFLAALYRSSPSEIAPFFAATEPLEKLLQEFTAIDVSSHELWPASNADGSSTRGIHSQVDAPLIDLLMKTVNLDSDRKGQAGVADFMSIASNDAKTVSVLQN